MRISIRGLLTCIDGSMPAGAAMYRVASVGNARRPHASYRSDVPPCARLNGYDAE